MKVLGFIPARGGSKRVPNKNIKLLGVKPLIAYTIEAAKRSKYINKLVISTDSQEIADVALKYGAEVPFLRPPEIAGSASTELEFFDHALAKLKELHNYEPDLIVLLYSTSPFRTTESIDMAIELMKANPRADSLRSVKLCSEHPYKMWVKEGNEIVPFVKTADRNTQTLAYNLLPMVYIQNASIYITKPSTIIKKRSPIGDIVIPFIMEELESVDINNQIDFEFAEYLLKKKESERGSEKK